MDSWTQIPSSETIQTVAEALKQNGITAEVVATGADAKKRVLELLPLSAEVMTMTSVTLDESGISKEINESGKYNSVHSKLRTMDRNTQSVEMQKLGTAPEWVVGSVHAVTADGHVLIASNTGSQLPAYVYGSAHVIWVVGAQKIVKNVDEGMKRIYQYTLSRESERAQKVYGAPSAVNKLLIFNREVRPGRVTLILIKEVIGF